MSDLDFRWPDEAAERVRAARERLAIAGRPLRARSLPDRLAAVARVLEDWTKADSPWRRELLESFSDTSPFSRGTVTEGLESALRAWDPARFVDAAERELACVLDARDGARPTRMLAPFEWTAVLAGGTIPMPTLLSSLLPLVLGSPVLLRETSKDPVTGGLIARSLAERDASLARAFETIEFPAEDGEALAILLSAPCIVATGTDETMRAIASGMKGEQRFVAYGHRVSIGILGPRVTMDLERIAHGFALDVARWDQTGCLSPIVVFLVGLDEEAQRMLAHTISQALDALATSMPRGELAVSARALHATERAEARMRAASGRALLLEGRDSVVVLESDARARPAPLHRFLRLVPVPSLVALAEGLGALGAPLSNVAVAGFSPDERAQLADVLAAGGTSRITSPGLLQTPPIDWPRDGLPLLTPLARLVQAAD
jgi:hypothetical protein